MSEATLQRFLARLNEDASYRDSVQADPEGAFAALELSPAEQVALTSGDADALRRLAGTEVSGFAAFVSPATIIRSVTPYCPRPTDTPGSGNGCGTGATHNCIAGNIG